MGTFASHDCLAHTKEVCESIAPPENEAVQEAVSASPGAANNDAEAKKNDESSLRPYCESCGTFINKIRDKSAHKNSHCDFSCCLCEQGFKDTDQLLDHYKVKHPKVEIKQAELDELYRKKGYISIKNKYFCDRCGHGFSFFHSLIQHKANPDCLTAPTKSAASRESRSTNRQKRSRSRCRSESSSIIRCAVCCTFIKVNALADHYKVTHKLGAEAAARRQDVASAYDKRKRAASAYNFRRSGENNGNTDNQNQNDRKRPRRANERDESLSHRSARGFERGEEGSSGSRGNNHANKKTGSLKNDRRQEPRELPVITPHGGAKKISYEQYKQKRLSNAATSSDSLSSLTSSSSSNNDEPRALAFPGVYSCEEMDIINEVNHRLSVFQADEAAQFSDEPDTDEPSNRSEATPSFCEACGLPAADGEALKQHMKLVHNGFSFKCFVCDVKCRDLDSLITHLAKYSKSVAQSAESRFLRQRKSGPNERYPYYCNLCGMGFTLINLIYVHKTCNHHAQSASKADRGFLEFCELCGLKHTSLADKRKHFHLHSFECVVCRQGFKHIDRLVVHYESTHSKDDVTRCEKSDMSAHEMFKYFCLFCGIGFYFIKDLLSHKAAHQKASSETSQSCNIDVHEYLHDHNIPTTFLPEDKWDEAANQLADVLTNEAILEDMYDTADESEAAANKMFCEACGFECDNQEALRSHFGDNHEESCFKCGVCGRRYESVADLIEHQDATHDADIVTCAEEHFFVEDAFRYYCGSCGQGFAYSREVKTHKNSACAKNLEVGSLQGDQETSSASSNVEASKINNSLKIVAESGSTSVSAAPNSDASSFQAAKEPKAEGCSLTNPDVKPQISELSVLSPAQPASSKSSDQKSEQPPKLPSLKSKKKRKRTKYWFRSMAKGNEEVSELLFEDDILKTETYK